MTSFVVEVLGSRVSLSLPSGLPIDVPDLRHAWSGALAPEGAAADAELVIDPGTMSHPALLSTVSSEVTHRGIDLGRGRLWMVHAGGVADDRGRVCMLVGRSGAGKTTAVRHLATSLGYVSDEAVAVRPDGTVVPYRKPLSIVAPDSMWKRQLAPDDLGLTPLPTAPLRLSAIVLLERTPDAAPTPQAHPLDTAEAVAALAPHSSALRQLPRPLHAIAAHVRRSGAYRLVYRDDADLAPIVADLLSGRAVPHPAEDVDGADAPRATARVARVPRGDGALIRLAGIAPSIWDAVGAEGASRDDVLAHVARVHGTPDDGSAPDRVDRAIDELVHTGLLHAAPEVEGGIRDAG